MYIDKKVEEDTGHSDMSNFVKLFIILSIKLYVKIYYKTKLFRMNVEVRMKRFLLCLIFLCICLTSCKLNIRRSSFNTLIQETNLKYLEYEDLDYFYQYTSGYDGCGLNYYVFTFEESPEEFFNQFLSNSFASKYKFNTEKNGDFEKKVFDKINLYIGDKYEEIEKAYKLNFTENYIYNEFPMFYFEKVKRLYIIEFLR